MDSDDGLCAIDVAFDGNPQGDTVRNRDIAGIVENILATCVEAKGLGGAALAPCKSINIEEYIMSLVRKAHLSTTGKEKEDKRRNFSSTIPHCP